MEEREERCYIIKRKGGRSNNINREKAREKFDIMEREGVEERQYHDVKKQCGEVW